MARFSFSLPAVQTDADPADPDSASVAAAFQRALRVLLIGVTVYELAAAFARGHNPLGILDWHAMRATLIAEMLAAQRKSALQSSADTRAAVVEPGSSADLNAEAAIDTWLRRSVPEVAQQLVMSTQDGLAVVLGADLAPAQKAALVLSLAGLTAPQVTAALRYRQTALDAGATAAETERRVDDYAEQALETRTTAIAVTAAQTAKNRGRTLTLIALVAVGVLSRQQKQRWVATSGRPCPICASLDGTVVSIDEPFDATYAEPPAHPRCMCVVKLIGRR